MIYDFSIHPRNKRINRKYINYLKENRDYINLGLNDDSDCDSWSASFMGPENTPYWGGIFFLRIKFSLSYPERPPRVNFETKIYHPNIDSFGDINLKILYSEWNRGYTIYSVILNIISLLCEPDLNVSYWLNLCPRNITCCNENSFNKTLYEKKAKEWTKKYAC